MPNLPESLESLFWLAFDGPDEAVDAAVENLCRAHPAWAATLRDRLDRWRSGRLPLASPASVVTALADRFDRSPAVALHDAAAEPFADETAGRMPLSLGKFQVQDLIGRGGMGEVFAAVDTDLNRRVALKFLQHRWRGRPETVRRFVEEAQLAAQLQHPSILPVYELGMARGRPFFAMKLIDGQTLAQVLLQARGSEGEELARLLEVFLKVCQAIAFAHRRGVLHRDLKPSNIMVGRFGEVQVLDWGLGKVVGSAEANEGHDPVATIRSGAGSDTPTGDRTITAGTPEYMPPEQATGGTGELGPRADVFALGAILCEILTGEPPYGGGTVEEVLAQAIRGDLGPAHARLRRSRAAPELIQLAMDALEPDPRRRPDNAEVMANRLSDHLAGVQEQAQADRVRAAVAGQRLRHASITVLAVAILGLVAAWQWQRATHHNEELRRTQGALQREVAEKRDALTDLEAKNAALALARAEVGVEVERTRRAYEDLEERNREVAAKSEALGQEVAMRRRTQEELEGKQAELERTNADLRAQVEARRRTEAELVVKNRELEATGRELEAALEESRRQHALAVQRGHLRWETWLPGLQRSWQDLSRVWPERLRALRQWCAQADEVVEARSELEPWRTRTAEHADAFQTTEAFFARRLGDLAHAMRAFERDLYQRARRELAELEVIERLSLTDAEERWRAARHDVAAAPAYRHAPLDVRPIAGLVPLGLDPRSGLLELYDLRSAANPLAVPERGAAGDVRLGSGAGIVFVLVPGGVMPGRPEVEVEPFLLARHELTRSQWRRLSGAPSRDEDAEDGSLPITGLCRADFAGVLERHGMRLPHPVHWEYACRAGSNGTWTCDRGELEHLANLAEGSTGDSELRPVGTLRANAWGLHDMHGNAWEWCGGDGSGIRSGAGAMPVRFASALTHGDTRRGGSCLTDARAAAAAGPWLDAWATFDPDLFADDLGVRAMQLLPKE